VNKKILMDVIGIELIALIVVVGYKLSPMLLPKADVTVFPEPACNLQKENCVVNLPSGGTIELSLGARAVPLVKPFEVAVTARGFAPDRVEVDFVGVDMNMGYNRPELKLHGDGRFNGEATLPVCISGHMDWQATVLVEAGNQRIAVPYRFSTGGQE
jgi:hypothetical protein